MIYGYPSSAYFEDGLVQLKEVHIAAKPDDLRALANFLHDAAEGVSWHRHLPEELRRRLGIEVIVWENKPPWTQST